MNIRGNLVTLYRLFNNANAIPPINLALWSFVVNTGKERAIGSDFPLRYNSPLYIYIYTVHIYIYEYTVYTFPGTKFILFVSFIVGISKRPHTLGKYGYLYLV